MKKLSVIIAALLALSLLCACGATPTPSTDATPAPAETEAPAETAEPTAEVTPSPEPVETPEPTVEVNYAEAYASVLDAYRDALANGATAGDMLDAGRSMLTSYAGEDKLASVGYAFIDLDGDGTDELLIGQISGDEFTDKVVYDAYTLKDGAPVQLFVSSERNRYYLYNGNLIANEGSSGADSSESGLFTLSGGQLVAGADAPDAANYIKPEYTAFSNY